MTERVAGTAPRKIWSGTPPTDCDLCGAVFINDFVDGATIFGPWVNMCPACHAAKGRGLGTGRGQHYRREVITVSSNPAWDKDEWVKVGG